MERSPGENQISGQNWLKEVKSVSGKKEIAERRREFYKKRAELKLNVEDDLDEVLNDPEKAGFLSSEEISSAGGVSKEMSRGKYERGKGERLVDVLGSFYKKALDSELDGVELDRQVGKEVMLTLYYLSNFEKDSNGRRLNVDLVRRGETVQIENGKLNIYRIRKDGKKVYRVKNVSLRGPVLKTKTDKRPVPPMLPPLEDIPPLLPELGEPVEKKTY